MSKENKVNPGTYTQAGRLSPDDSAREYKKQRDAGSPKNTEGGQFGENVPPVVTPKDKRQNNKDDEQNDEE